MWADNTSPSHSLPEWFLRTAFARETKPNYIVLKSQAIKTSLSFIGKVFWPKLRHCWLCNMKFKYCASVCQALSHSVPVTDTIPKEWSVPGDWKSFWLHAVLHAVLAPVQSAHWALQRSNILPVPPYIHIPSLHVPDSKLSTQPQPVKPVNFGKVLQILTFKFFQLTR